MSETDIKINDLSEVLRPGDIKVRIEDRGGARFNPLVVGSLIKNPDDADKWRVFEVIAVIDNEIFWIREREVRGRYWEDK